MSPSTSTDGGDCGTPLGAWISSSPPRSLLLKREPVEPQQESPGSVVSSDFIPNVNGEIDLINGPYQDGEYHLNGNQAVAYARIRHLDSDNVRASPSRDGAPSAAHQPEEKEHLPAARPGAQGVSLCARRPSTWGICWACRLLSLAASTWRPSPSPARRSRPMAPPWIPAPGSMSTI